MRPVDRLRLGGLYSDDRSVELGVGRYLPVLNRKDVAAPDSEPDLAPAVARIGGEGGFVENMIGTYCRAGADEEAGAADPTGDRGIPSVVVGKLQDCEDGVVDLSHV